LLALVLYEQFGRRFVSSSPIDESPNRSGKLRFPSRCLVITDLSYGGEPLKIPNMPESMDYRVRMQPDSVGPWLRSLVLTSVGVKGSVERVRLTVPVDTGVLFFACCESFNRLCEKDLAKKAMMDLVQAVEAGSDSRFSILHLDGADVGLVCIPSEGDGIYDVEVSRNGADCVEVKAIFR
jgi:hypothetical protein